MNSETRTGASRHFVLAAGGTGGHLIPAFALAAELAPRVRVNATGDTETPSTRAPTTR